MIETYLNEVINERVKSHISLKNNWNITSEIGILVDLANENEALLPIYFYWLKNYFNAVGIPFD